METTKLPGYNPRKKDGSQDLHLKYNELMVIYLALHFLMENGYYTIPAHRRLDAADLIHTISRMVEPEH